MPSRFDQQHARRVFEETLAAVNRRYAPEEDVMLDAVATDETGHEVIVARYKVYTDGRIECFEILNDVLWPNL
jgi:hypothetical protein